MRASGVTSTPVNIEDFAWDALEACGVTALGKAFEFLSAQITIPPMLSFEKLLLMACTHEREHHVFFRRRK